MVGIGDFGAWCAQVRRFRERFLSEYGDDERGARAHFLNALARTVLDRYSDQIDVPHFLADMPALDGSTSSGPGSGDALELSASEIAALAEEPTLVGWSYQIWNEVGRDAGTWAISRKGLEQAEQLSIVAATQIFTEEYMADFLAARCHELLHARVPNYTVVDPACGTGHLLARVFRLLIEQQAAERAVASVGEIAKRIYGCDIDADAVCLCRVVLLLECLRSAPGAARDVVAALKQNVFVLQNSEGVLDRSCIGPGLPSQYDCVVANPPYLGRRKLTQVMRDRLELDYPDSALDLCAAVTRRCVELTALGGVVGLVTSDRWLRLKGYQRFRAYMCGELLLHVVAELGDRAFRSQLDLHDGVRVVLTVAQRDAGKHEHQVQYLSAVSLRDVELKAKYLRRHLVSDATSKTFLQGELRDDTDGSVFLGVAGAPQALQVASARLVKHAQIVVGLQTNNDAAFVRYHWQVAHDPALWCPHNKGGGYARWFGLNRWVLDVRSENFKLYSKGGAGGISLEEWFAQSGWTYSWFANGCLGVRRKEGGWSFGRAASSGLFCDDVRIIAFCNSRLASLGVRLIGGKIQLPEGIVRQLPVPDDLSAVDPALVDAALGIKKRLVSSDLTEITFSPSESPSLRERWVLEALLLMVEGELERQVMQSARMSSGEREHLAGVIAEPVALRYATWSMQSCEQMRQLVPQEWRNLFDSLVCRISTSHSQVGEARELSPLVHENVQRMLRGGRPARNREPSFPAVGPVEQVCMGSGVHPVEVVALLDTYLGQTTHRNTAVLVEECKRKVFLAVLKELGFRWYSEGVQVRVHRQLSADEIAEALTVSLDLPEISHMLKCPVREWIQLDLISWHTKQLLNVPIIRYTSDAGLFQVSHESTTAHGDRP
jgi:hypothetical protein